jgi:hypothetical protein
VCRICDHLRCARRSLRANEGGVAGNVEHQGKIVPVPATSLPGFHLFSHRLEVALNSIAAHRDAVDERERLNASRVRA